MNTLSEPVNHHFVPEHFLKAWASNNKRSLIGKYLFNEFRKKVVFLPNQSIRRQTASQDNLYTLTDGKETAQFEASVMTERLDSPSFPLLEKVREQGFHSLSSKLHASGTLTERDMFLRYVIALEIRNPKTIAELGVSREEIAEIGNSFPSVRQSTRDEVIKLMQGVNVETLISGLLVANDDTYSILSKAKFGEIQVAKDTFFTSNYPVGRAGSYDTEFLVTLAVTPRHALVWGNGILFDGVTSLTEEAQSLAINLLTLRAADEAYDKSDNCPQFISDNWNWKGTQSLKEQMVHFLKFLSAL